MLSLVPNWQESRNYRDRKAAQVTLYSELQKAHTEEDVTSIYIKALGLKNHSQGFEDMQHAGQETLITSSIYTGGNGGGLYINAENLLQSATVFSVRRLVKPTWLNDRDQFLQPSVAIPEEFKNDCLIWMLFNGSNLSAGANSLKWDGKTWSLVNHFIPFTEKEVGASGRFESDFMSSRLAKVKLSDEAKSVLKEGRILWRKYHATAFEKKIRDEFKLNRPDVGWYQIRKALEANNENEPVDFAPFKSAYDALGEKLRPQVYSLGFLK